MKIYQNIPRELVDGWPSEDVHHPCGSERVDFHYHGVEEWLEVSEGTITFFTARDVRMHSSWAKR